MYSSQTSHIHAQMHALGGHRHVLSSLVTMFPCVSAIKEVLQEQAQLTPIFAILGDVHCSYDENFRSGCRTMLASSLRHKQHIYAAIKFVQWPHEVAGGAGCSPPSAAAVPAASFASCLRCSLSYSLNSFCAWYGNKRDKCM